MKYSKLTSKYQATVPKEVRDFLNLESGEGITWEVEDDVVIVKKIAKFDLEWQKSIEASFTEWASKEDDEAYGSL